MTTEKQVHNCPFDNDGLCTAEIYSEECTICRIDCSAIKTDEQRNEISDLQPKKLHNCFLHYPMLCRHTEFKECVACVMEYETDEVEKHNALVYLTMLKSTGVIS